MQQNQDKDNQKVFENEFDVLFGAPKVEEELSIGERRRFQAIFSDSMKKAAFVLSNLLKKKINITNPRLNVTSPNVIKEEINQPAIVIEFEYTKGLKGPTCIIMLKEQGAVIGDLLLGADGRAPPQELSDLYINALNEALCMMLNEANTELSAALGKSIEIGELNIKTVDFLKEDVYLEILKESQVVKINYDMKIENLCEGIFIQLFPIDLAKSVVSEFPQEAPSPKPVYIEKETIQPLEFGPLREAPIKEIPANIRLIMDIPMDVSVELGRTRIKVKEILNLAIGSIVELPKSSNEPVEILVNGKVIAKGVVVVVDGCFGVRITEILEPTERI